jgi:asparagine synthase (glutamine-hydrolysing)
VDPRIEEREAKECLSFELDRAVREHLISDVPVGVFLSSGLDSTIIAGLAKRHSPNVRAFTVGFADQPDMAESALARETARLLGIEHHDIQITGDQSEAMTVRWLESLDQPSIDGLNTYVISKAIRDAGVVVALSGLGGDELFAGYPLFTEVPRLLRLAKTLSWMPAKARAQIFSAIAMRRPASVRSKIKEMGFAGADLQRLYYYRRRGMSDERLRRLGVVANELGLDPMFLDKDVVREAHVGMDDPVAAISRLDSQFYMGNTLLRDSDTNGMAHSLEIRVPLIDTRVLDLAYSIPGAVRAPIGAASKHLLRATFGDFLRPSLLTQVKKGFSLPIKRWMVGPLRPLCESALGYVKDQGIVEPSAVASTWTTFLKDPEQPIWSSAFLFCVLGKYLQRSVEYARPIQPDVLRLSPAPATQRATGAAGVS